MQNITLPEKIVIIAAVIILLLVGIGGVAVYNNLYAKSEIAELSPQALLESVSKLAELPNEQPTIATVTDKEKLANFQFFSQAQVGDRVLIFNEAKKAYLYRPSSNKIVEVGPILIAENPSSPEPEPQPENAQEASVAAVQTEPATVTLLNGTKGKGVASSAEKELAERDLSIEVVATGNSKKDYTKTRLSVINGEQTQTAEKLAEELNAEIIPLPEGELKPKSDIVVFLGNDRL